MVSQAELRQASRRISKAKEQSRQARERLKKQREQIQRAREQTKPATTRELMKGGIRTLAERKQKRVARPKIESAAQKTEQQEQAVEQFEKKVKAAETQVGKAQAIQRDINIAKRAAQKIGGGLAKDQLTSRQYQFYKQFRAGYRPESVEIKQPDIPQADWTAYEHVLTGERMSALDNPGPLFKKISITPSGQKTGELISLGEIDIPIKDIETAPVSKLPTPSISELPDIEEKRKTFEFKRDEFEIGPSGETFKRSELPARRETITGMGTDKERIRQERLVETEGVARDILGDVEAGIMPTKVLGKEIYTPTRKDTEKFKDLLEKSRLNPIARAELNNFIRQREFQLQRDLAIVDRVTDNIDSYGERFDKLNKQLNNGTINQETYNKRIESISNEMEKRGFKVNKTEEQIKFTHPIFDRLKGYKGGGWKTFLNAAEGNPTAKNLVRALGGLDAAYEAEKIVLAFQLGGATAKGLGIAPKITGSAKALKTLKNVSRIAEASLLGSYGASTGIKGYVETGDIGFGVARGLGSVTGFSAAARSKQIIEGLGKGTKNLGRFFKELPSKKVPLVRGKRAMAKVPKKTKQKAKQKKKPTKKEKEKKIREFLEKETKTKYNPKTQKREIEITTIGKDSPYETKARKAKELYRYLKDKQDPKALKQYLKLLEQQYGRSFVSDFVQQEIALFNPIKTKTPVRLTAQEKAPKMVGGEGKGVSEFAGTGLYEKTRMVSGRLKPSSVKSLALINVNKELQKERLTDVQRESLLKKQKILTKSLQDESPLIKTQQATATGLTSLSKTKLSEAQVPRLTTRLATGLTTTTKTGLGEKQAPRLTTGGTTRRPGQRPRETLKPKPPVPGMPKFPKGELGGLPEGFISPTSEKARGFVALARRRGQLKRVHAGAFKTPQQAKAFLGKHLDTTLSASGQVVGLKDIKKFRKAPAYKFKNGDRFREFRIRKGKKVQVPGLLIERKRYRLSTGKETTDIQKARKRSQSFRKIKNRREFNGKKRKI